MRKKVYSNKWIPRFDYEEVVQSKKYLLPYILPYTECRKEEDKKDDEYVSPFIYTDL